MSGEFPDESLIRRGADILRAGGLVAIPTETVYGLGADATQPSAVQKIFAAKGRPATNPLIAHVADAQTARRFTTQWPEEAEKLARAFWPGPLTIILPKSKDVCDEATAGGATVALRVPNHPIALALLREFGGAVAAPSANRSNRVSPTTAEHVRLELGERVNLILDGGPCEVGVESTVVDLTVQPPRILRPGVVNQEQIQRIVGNIDITAQAQDSVSILKSPGMLSRHYAPRAMLRLFDPDNPRPLLEWLAGNRDVTARVLKIRTSLLPKWKSMVISMPTNPAGYAHNLYAVLHAIDAQGVAMVWVEAPPDTQEWSAVRDRLLRASTE